MLTLNKPLHIAIRIFDNKSDSDIEERKFSYRISKINVDIREFKSLKAAEAEHLKQKEGLDRKFKSIIDTIIWAANNGKTLEISNALEE